MRSSERRGRAADAADTGGERGRKRRRGIRRSSGLGFCAGVLPPLPVAGSAWEIAGVQIGFCLRRVGLW